MRRGSETRRTDRPRLRRRKATPGAVVAVSAVALIGVLAIVLGWRAVASQGAAPVAANRSVTTSAQEASVTVSEPLVEVPQLTGLTLEEAETVLSAAGMPVQVVPEDPNAPGGTGTVVDQKPALGEVVEPGTAVTVVVRKTPRQPAKDSASKKKSDDGKARYVVCIDPGHQARSNAAPEPIGPGAGEVKPKVTGGATGVKTRIPEYEIVLQISTNLKRRLEAEGIKVVMTRTTNDVNLSNSERAAIANRAKADLFVRVHGDGSPDAKVAGLSTLYPAYNRWTKPFAAESKEAATAIQSAAVAATGAVDRGIVARQDLSGFNYAKMPAVLVETGFLSNSVEDRLLSSPHYQDKIAEGMAAGILAYLAEAGSR